MMSSLDIELTKEEAQVVLQMIMQFNWAGQNLESTEKNVAVAAALREKFKNAVDGDIK